MENICIVLFRYHPFFTDIFQEFWAQMWLPQNWKIFKKLTFVTQVVTIIVNTLPQISYLYLNKFTSEGAIFLLIIFNSNSHCLTYKFWEQKDFAHIWIF